MKESFEHDPFNKFDWNKNVPAQEKEKIVSHVEGDDFYTMGADENVSSSNKPYEAIRKARKDLLTPEDLIALKSQLDAHDTHSQEDTDKFENNDKEIIEIKEELKRMGLTVEDFGRDIEFTDPVARDQFEEMASRYYELAKRNAEIATKLKTLEHKLN